MKKRIIFVLAIALFAFALSACAPKAEAKVEEVVVKIGVSPAPHAEIVKQVEEDLAKEGVKLEIIEYSDYIVPNLALDQGDIDINFFQHAPYLEAFSKENNLDLEVLGGIHIEPMAVYSDQYKSLDEIPDGAEIYFPNDATNGGRALLLLEKSGLIELAPNAGLEANENDILKNPKGLVFTPLEAAVVAKVYKDAAAAVINGNYAIENGLNPVEDSIAIEDADSPYVNVLAIRKGEASNEAYQKVLKAIQSDKVKKFIQDNYKGGVIPTF